MMALERWTKWDADSTYHRGDWVMYQDRLWRAGRTVTGAPPGSSAAWEHEPQFVQTDKATMAATIDERIGRGH